MGITKFKLGLQNIFMGLGRIISNSFVHLCQVVCGRERFTNKHDSKQTVSNSSRYSSLSLFGFFV